MRHGRRQAMRTKQVLPAVAMLLALLTFTGCANGGGLRVEGADAPSTTTPATAPSIQGSQGFGKTDKTPVTVSLAQVRQTLLADKSLDQYFRTVLSKCSVVER